MRLPISIAGFLLEFVNSGGGTRSGPYPPHIAEISARVVTLGVQDNQEFADACLFQAALLLILPSFCWQLDFWRFSALSG
jgi:hypothetical protein